MATPTINTTAAKGMMDHIVVAVRAAAEATGVHLDPMETMREALVVWAMVIKPQSKAEVPDDGG